MADTTFKKGHKYYPRTEKGLIAMKEKMGGDNNPMKRKEVSEKNSQARKGNNGKRGSLQTEETKRKISDAHKGKKKPWAGKHITEAGRKKLRENKGAKCYNWKGGITPINQAIRNSLEYKLWRKAVFERDKYTCVFCTARGGYLEADHIKRFSDFPELRFAIDNGRTLCKPCHLKTDTYGNRLR